MDCLEVLALIVCTMNQRVFLLLLFVSSFCWNSLLYAQSPASLWAVANGGTQTDRIYDVATDAAGNIIVTGDFQGTVDFDPGPGVQNLTAPGFRACFVQKLDPAGNLIWAETFGGSAWATGLAVETDPSGNILVAGNFFWAGDFDPGPGVVTLTASNFTDVFVMKLNPLGNMLWAKEVGGAQNDRVEDLALSTSGDVCITGSFFDQVDFDPGTGTNLLTSNSASLDIFVLKLNTSGNFEWATAMGSPQTESGYSVAFDANENVFVTGDFYGTVDFDPGAGTQNLTSAGDRDLFVQKLDPNGNLDWAERIGSSDTDYGRALTIDPAGDVLITGKFEQSVDFDPGSGTFVLTSGTSSSDYFVLKLTNNGQFQWAKNVGGFGGGEGSDIASDQLGNVYVSGQFGGTLDFDPGTGVSNQSAVGSFDVFLQKLNPNGQFEFVYPVGDITLDIGYGLSIDPAGHPVVAGIFSGAPDFDPGPGSQTPPFLGDLDGFVWKLAPAYDSVLIVTACDSFTVPSGSQTYTTDGLVMDTLLNSIGGDSVLAIFLTVLESSAATQIESACDSLVSPSGLYTYTISGTYFDTLQNAAGCDSLITIQLTIGNNDSIILVTACDSFVSPSGLYTWSSSGIYQDTLTNQAGCDSVLTIDLTIDTVDVSVSFVLDGHTIVAEAMGAKYRWLDCALDFQPVSSQDTLSYFTAPYTGEFAVEVTQNGCVDTSLCYLMSGVGINELSFSERISLYPNPTNGVFTIQFEQQQAQADVVILDALGRELQRKTFLGKSVLEMEADLPTGWYVLRISAGDAVATKSLIIR